MYLFALPFVAPFVMTLTMMASLNPVRVPTPPAPTPAPKPQVVVNPDAFDSDHFYWSSEEIMERYSRGV